MPINDTYDIGAAFAAIESELIASMIRNMRRHKGEEIKEDKQWSMWQTEQLKSLEKYKRQNKAKYNAQFKSINKQIEGLIQAANDEGMMEQEISILRAIKKGFTTSRASAGTVAEFFKLNDRKLETLIRATMDDMQRAEVAVLRMANDQYRKVIYNAQVYANSGAGTYEKAVDMATRDYVAAGINCIEYSNGARHTLPDYARMAIRTASKRAYLQGEGVKRQEWGIHTVIVNKRGNPCPRCLPFVGKVLIDDVWSGGSRKDGKYPLMSSAVAAGLYHPNCKDSHTTYFPGISTPPDDRFSKKEIADVEQQIKQEAKDQYANRQAERMKRMAKYSLDPENKKRYERRAEQWKEIDEGEFSPRKSTKGSFGVNWEKVVSPEYRKSLEKLSDNPKVVDAIEIRSKWALNNRDGLRTEEMYAVNLDTGKEIASVLDQQIESGVNRTPTFTRKLNKADKAKEKILLIHNHPKGLPPSIADINMLLENKNVSGITVGHDGSIYYYTRPKKEITDLDFKVALRKYSRYTELTNMEKALEELSKEYKFEVRKL